MVGSSGKYLIILCSHCTTKVVDTSRRCPGQFQNTTVTENRQETDNKRDRGTTGSRQDNHKEISEQRDATIGDNYETPSYVSRFFFCEAYNRPPRRRRRRFMRQTANDKARQRTDDNSIQDFRRIRVIFDMVSFICDSIFHLLNKFAQMSSGSGQPVNRTSKQPLAGNVSSWT